MSLEVHPSGKGDARGSHLSAFVFLIAGENDHKLVWPFRGEVTFAILNQLANSSHFTATVRFEEEEISASTRGLLMVEGHMVGDFTNSWRASV